MKHILATLPVMVIFLNQLSIGVTNAMEVVLNRYRRYDLIKECEALFVEGDNLILNGTVTFDSHMDPSVANVFLMVKSLDETNFRESHGQFFENCKLSSGLSCVRRGDSQVYDISINTTMNDLLIESFLKLRVEYKNETYYSDEIKAPPIFNYSSGVLKINGHVITQGNETIDMKERSIELCCEFHQFPCIPIISPLFSPQMNRPNCIINKPITVASVKYKVGYILCPPSTHLYTYDVDVPEVSEVNSSDSKFPISFCKIELPYCVLPLIVFVPWAFLVAIAISGGCYYFKAYRKKHYNPIATSDNTDVASNLNDNLATNANQSPIQSPANETITHESCIMPPGGKLSRKSLRHRGGRHN